MEKTLELQKLIDNNSYVKIKKGVYLTETAEKVSMD